MKTIILTLVVVVVAAVSWLAAQSTTAGVQDPRALAAPDVPLRIDDGTALSLAHQTAPTLLMFGYVRCGDVCPTTLHALSRALAESSYRVKPRILFVDVDTADTTVAVRRFVSNFPGVRGVVGDRRSVAALEAALNVAPTARRGEELEHEGRVFVLDRGGVVLGSLPPGSRVSVVHAMLDIALRQS